MSTTLDQIAGAKKTKKSKQYGTELEKKLLVDNLRVAVEIYGKDRLRKEFKIKTK